MENNANYALVGVLATAIIVALFGFVYWFAGSTSNVATKPYDVVFTGTVSGIGAGTNVLFNGIKVGQVNTVELDPADTARVIAHIEVDATAPVKADTRVLMGFQGLTGAGSLQLSGGTQAAGEPQAAPGSTVPTLYAETADFQSLLDGLSSTVNGASSAVNRINSILDENDTRLNATIANVETFSAALAANSDGVGDFLATISEAGKEIGPMATEIKTLSSDLRGLVEAVQPEQVAKAVSDVTTFTDSLARNSGQIDDFFDTTAVLSKNLTDLTEGLNASVEVIDQVAAEIDPKVIGRVLANADSFAARINTMSADLESLIKAVPPEQVASVVANAATFTDTLARNSSQIDTFVAGIADLPQQVGGLVDSLGTSIGIIDQVTAKIDPDLVGRVLGNVDAFSAQLGDNAGKVDAIMDNAAALTASLNGSAEQVSAILAKVDDVVSSAEGQGMFDQIAQAAQSVRALADQLNASTTQIAVGLNNFTSRGLSEYSSLAVDARATLQRLDRVVRNLENNPQGLIFGGETVRDYNKQ